MSDGADVHDEPRPERQSCLRSVHRERLTAGLLQDGERDVSPGAERTVLGREAHETSQVLPSSEQLQ